MKVKRIIGLTTALIMMFSFLFGYSNVAEASSANPKKAVVVSTLSHPTTTVIHTYVYLNATEAKKLSTKLKNKNTKATDIGAFLVSLVPYIGPFLGASYMIGGWKNADDAAKIDKLLKSNKGVRVTYVTVKGRGASSPKLASINAWNGSSSTVKSHYTLTSAQKKSPFKHKVEKKIYP